MKPQGRPNLGRRRMAGVVVLGVWSALVAAPSVQAADSLPLGRLLAFVSPICPHCRLFEEEVVGSYAKTDVGKELPLRLVDTFDPPQEFAEQARYVAFTPCMIVQTPDGKEFARIRGYRGNEFFWGELDSIVQRMRSSANLSRRN